ncbi:MAG: hypothetical protein QW815_05550 [Nitrososphaerota archaeon]
MPTANPEKIRNMLIDGYLAFRERNTKSEWFVYTGDALWLAHSLYGLLVYRSIRINWNDDIKRVYEELGLPGTGIIGATDITPLSRERELVRSMASGRIPAVVSLNGGESVACYYIDPQRAYQSTYLYIYRENAWHRPILPGHFKGVTEKIGEEGLQFSLDFEKQRDPQYSIPYVSGISTTYDPRYPEWRSVYIWGYVPFDEILAIHPYEGTIAARRAMVVSQFEYGRSPGVGFPTDRDPQHYMSFEDFLRMLR